MAKRATRVGTKPTPKPKGKTPLSYAIIALCAAGLGWFGYQSSNGKMLPPLQNPCLSQFYQDAAPELTNVKLKAQSYPLCYGAFNVIYSGISRTPLWVAEKLTLARVSTKIKREDNFHEETRLPENVRSRLEDYRGSGFDRGHMAPNGDMSDKATQFDSFTLANIVPQTSENNQNTWREIEESVRTMTGRYKTDVYVVTGPAFLNSTVRYIKKGHPVLVPSHVYKAIYIPELGIASAYFSPNDTSYSAQIISICALEEKIGINIFPRVSEQLKRQVYGLPLHANLVKTNRLPQQVNSDDQSQCAPAISDTQVKSTQQQFIAPDLSDNNSENPRYSPTSRESTPQYSGDVNKILIPILKWIKHQ